MDNEIYLIGEVGYDITLDTVIKAVESTNQDETLTVNIHSGGGSVYDGLAIYNYLKGLKQDVITKSSGLVASIASIIFLAGIKESRSINETDNFLIHLPMSFGGGNAEDFEKNAKELRKIEGTLADIYAKETDLTKDEAMELMKKDEMMDVAFLKEKGFVSEIVEFKAVATLTSKKMEKPVTKEQVEGIFAKFTKKFFNKEKEVENKVIQDATGVEITFAELDKSDTPAIDDKAVVNGKNAKGDYTLPSGDVYSFENGILTAIQIMEEETVETLKAQIDKLKDEAQVSAQSVVEKDAEVTAAVAKMEEMKTEFETLKNEITGSFDYKKKDNKKEEPNKKTGRSLFKN